MKKNRFLKPWRLVLYILLILLLRNQISWFGDGWNLKNLDTQVTIAEWESISKIFESISSGLKKTRLKMYHRNNPDALEVLQPGTYIFSGSYDFASFFELLNQWPALSYQSLTLLEWWSMYDIDLRLTEKEYIQEWEYIDFVSNQEIIKKYKERFEFLQLAWPIDTLEWYLYPETYFVDPELDLIDQLVLLQLQTYDSKVWTPYADQIKGLSNSLQSMWFEFVLSPHAALKLASVIEKEERVDKNKPLIASVFFNRLNQWTRIDADITLCYGLGESYRECTPEVIVRNLDDADNLYNTRRNNWLPPGPIANIHVSSMEAVLEAEKSEYEYYLHDTDGQIHLSKTLSEHNQNKSKYLN